MRSASAFAAPVLLVIALALQACVPAVLPPARIPAPSPVSAHQTTGARAHAHPRGVCHITFDDSIASPKVRGAFAYLEEKGLPATLFTIVDHLGTPGCLTREDLLVQRSKGWEIGGHAYSSAVHNASGGITGLAEVAVRRDLRETREWLDANIGSDTRSYAYPQGGFGATADGAATDGIVADYFDVGRTAVAGPSTFGSGRRGPCSASGEALDPIDTLHLRCVSNISTSGRGLHIEPEALYETGGVIDVAAASRERLFLNFHNIVADAAPCRSASDLRLSDFEKIVDRVLAAGMDVEVVGEVNAHPASRALAGAAGTRSVPD